VTTAKKLGCVKEIIQNKVAKDMPLLGICVELQLFFEENMESYGAGLALFNGKIIQFQSDLKFSHIGWDTINIVKSCALFDGITDGVYAYFVRSLYSAPIDESGVCAKITYGTIFASAVVVKNGYGFQVHPEKLGDVDFADYVKLYQTSNEVSKCS